MLLCWSIKAGGRTPLWFWEPEWRTLIGWIYSRKELRIPLIGGSAAGGAVRWSWISALKVPWKLGICFVPRNCMKTNTFFIWFLILIPSVFLFWQRRFFLEGFWNGSEGVAQFHIKAGGRTPLWVWEPEWRTLIGWTHSGRELCIPFIGGCSGWRSPLKLNLSFVSTLQTWHLLCAQELNEN